MFDFRVIHTVDGNQIIDRRGKTFYSELTPLEMMEYVEIDAQLFIMDMQKRKASEETERRRKIANPLYRIACMCRLV